MSVLIKFVLLCFNFDNFSLIAAMTSLWSLSILSFRLIPKKLMSSYTGMEECEKQTQPLREKCKNNL